MIHAVIPSGIDGFNATMPLDLDPVQVAGRIQRAMSRETHGFGLLDRAGFFAGPVTVGRLLLCYSASEIRAARTRAEAKSLDGLCVRHDVDPRFVLWVIKNTPAGSASRSVSGRASTTSSMTAGGLTFPGPHECRGPRHDPAG